MGSDEPERIAADAGGTAPTYLDLTRPDAYGRAFAEVYDGWYGPAWSSDDLGAMVSFVMERSPSGVVIELGVGSGRLARPLTDAGLAVIGLDVSLPMLRRCPETVWRVAGDMADLPFRAITPGRDPGAPTVLCGFNTLFNLVSTEALDRLLATVASLRAAFIVEMANTDLLPDEPIRSTGGTSFMVDGGIVVSATAADPAHGRLTGRHLEITDRGVVSRPWRLRLVGHDELDARARRHGLAVTERHQSWLGTPFSADDPASVSVYRPIPAPRPAR